MEHPKRPLSMRMKILLSCIVCMLLALALQTLLFYRSSSAIIYSQARQISGNTMENLQDDLYAFNKSVENSLIKIYNHSAFIRDLGFGTDALQLSGEYGQLTYDLSHSAFTPAQNLVALYLYTPDHSLISNYRHAQTPLYSYPEDIFQDETVKADTDLVQRYVASDERVMLLTGYYNPHRDTPLVRYVLKIYRNAHEYIGYIVCDIDPKPFLRLMEKYRYSPEQVIWLQPQGDGVTLQVGQLQPGQQALFEDITGRVHAGQDPAAEAGGDYTLFTAPQRKYNFAAYTLMPQALLQMNQAALLNNTLLVAGIIVVLLTVLFLIVSRSLTGPLTYVLQTMQRIKQGHTALRLKPMKQDEIGILGREFNDMLDETERLLKQDYESRLLLNDAKYKALQAQVNPHFLYNTLDTMGSIAGAQQCSTVSTLCHALSNIFRYSLNMQTPYSTLENEILHIKNYMYIMNVRTNHSIRMSINIDSALLECQMPRLSIQPLVENSIQHGLKNKRGSKDITIGARRSGQVLEVWVEDNGVGMDAAALNRRLAHSVADALQKNDSIGIDNINARAKLLYGPDYGVTVASEPGAGSRVTLRLPVAAPPAPTPDERSPHG